MNRIMYQMQKREPLNHDQLQKTAPSIFSERPSEKVSNKYAFVPTVQVVEQLEKRNWYPVNAREQRVLKDDGRQGYQKHVIRFHMPHQLDQSINEVIPEIVLTNSHNRSSCFQFSVGLFRLVCSNGLLVADAMISQMKVRHIGYNNDQVHHIIDSIVEHTPTVLNRLDDLKQIELTRQEQTAFATSAAMEKWNIDLCERLPFEPEKLLTPHRHEDTSPSLWNTYNTVQENLTKGGLRYIANKDGHRTRHKTRPITSINKDLRTNKALWMLTENMRRIKIGEPVISN